MMNYKIIIIFFFFFIVSCANQNYSNKKKSESIIYNKYSNNGFTLVYTEDLYKNKTVNKKLNDRDLFVFQMNLCTRFSQMIQTSLSIH